MAVLLKEHNKEAYAKLTRSLSRESRACVIQPPGTGKSFLALKLIEDNPAARVLWMGPNDYVFNEQAANFTSQGLHIPSNVTTMTYAMAMSKERKGEAFGNYDIIILDEFHHIGAPEWGKGVKGVTDANPDAKVVGLSATAIRYGDGNRDMSEELFFGNVASRLDMTEAWIRGILPFPTYVCALYEAPDEIGQLYGNIKNHTSGRIKRSLEERFSELRRQLDYALDVPAIIAKHLHNPSAKIIVFCPNVEKLEAFYALQNEWFSKAAKSIHGYKTYSSNPSGESEYVAFREDNSEALKVLYCINQLNEGVHVNGVEAIIMVRPTGSPVVYKQQLGRALDAGGSSTPLVFDLVNNIETAGSMFAYTGAMGKLYERMTSEGHQGLVDPREFKIIDSVRDVRFLMHEIAQAIDPEIGTLAERGAAVIDLWDNEKNSGLSPYSIPSNSNYLAWWKCSTCGESWQEKVFERARRHRCPYCSGERVSAGFNDLETRHPAIAKSWNIDKNGMPANAVTEKSYIGKAWWVCPNCKHEWQTTIKDRIATNQCPKCAKREVKRGVNDLATRCPESLKDWNPKIDQRNAIKGITPKTVLYTDAQIIFEWKCCRCGTHWESTARERSIRGAKCPKCSEANIAQKKKTEKQDEPWSFAEKYPQLAREWSKAAGHNSKRPKEVSHRYDQDVVWRCKTCGMIWSALATSRVASLERNGAIVDCPRCKQQSYASENETIATIKTAKAESTKGTPLLGAPVESKKANRKRIVKNEPPNSSQNHKKTRPAKGVLKYPEPGERTFKDAHPALAKEWVTICGEEKRGPETARAGAPCYVRWKCSKCGTEWTDAASRRVKRYESYNDILDCPKCGIFPKPDPNNASSKKTDAKKVAGLFVADYPQLAREWVSSQSAKKVDVNKLRTKTDALAKWKCTACGWTWTETTRRRIQRISSTSKYPTDCPNCKGSRFKSVEKRRIKQAIADKTADRTKRMQERHIGMTVYHAEHGRGFVQSEETANGSIYAKVKFKEGAIETFDLNQSLKTGVLSLRPIKGTN